ncbi:hypothetical protein PGT21_024173 [Puccinia graminis f. sp. tritici]|uniref:Ras-GAP domain-containing protein n=1 Tax=Puccinia graminis f. sp. tritici TaxID=56615 RepID=A0A5B0MS96_PUCGR|nr:hypothetical protein PGT21_024173 [Puccinia graminis f. sp. tritici]KAA1078896.1 hypothetical protein PGTUg99_017996 [Puccinia graminis f. sp. tritici]
MQKLVDSPTSSSSALNGFESHRARLKQFRRQAIHSIGLNSKLTQQEQQQQIRLTQDLTHSLTNPSSSPSAKPTLMMVNRKTEQEQPTLNPDSPIHLQSRDEFRSNSQDSRRGPFEIHSPATSVTLDRPDASSSVNLTRQSFTSTTPPILNQFGTTAQDLPNPQSKLDRPSNSEYRFPPASAITTELAQGHSHEETASKVGSSILNSFQTHQHHQLDLQPDLTNLPEAVPGTFNQINLQPHTSSDDGPQDHPQSNPSKPNIPAPLKIFPSSYRRSISAPFTSNGLLDFSGRLDSITEDGILSASAQMDSSYHLMNPLRTPMPYGGSDDTRDFSSMKFPFEGSPPTRSLDRSSPTQSNIPDQSTRPSSASSQSDHMYRKWTGSFYVWVYDAPSITSDTTTQSSSAMTNNPSTASNLSNNLIGGISKHFFQHVKPNNSGFESKSSKLLIGKKERRGVKLGLISGLTKQKDALSSSQLESSGAATSLNTHRPNLDPHSLSEHLDALVDRSAIDTIEISKLNQTRFPSSSKTADQPTKSKKHPFNAESKSGRRKFISESSGSGGGSGSITSHLALGPGAAMNSQGIGSGQWKLVQGVITEDGHFTLYSGNDVILYRIYLPSYRRTDVRMVHQSIFGRPHCGVITRRIGNTASSTNAPIHPSMPTSSTSLPIHPSSSFFSSSTNGSLSSLTPSTFSNPHRLGPSPSMPTAANMQDTTKSLGTDPANSASQQGDPSAGASELSVYICMPNSVLLESWLVICKCFCRPDDFRHLYPRSNKKSQNGGHKGAKSRLQSLSVSQSNQELSPSPALSSTGEEALAKNPVNSVKQGLPERVRIWRGVEIQLLEGRKLGETRQITVNSAIVDSSSGAAGVPNPTKLMTKEERRNSTGGFLHTSSQTSLLSINKEALFNKSNFGKHQTAQQFIINDPSQQPERQNLKQKLTQRSNSKNNDDFDDSTTGFSSSITSNLSGLTNRQSLQTSSLPNYEDKPASTASISATIPSHESSTHSSKHNSISNNSFNDNFYFVELDWDKEIIGRSTIKRNANPFWSESFKFSEIGSFKVPLILNVYQIKRNLNNVHSKSSSNPNHPNQNSSSPPVSSTITLIGQSQLDFKTFEKNTQLQLWLPIYSNANNTTAEFGGDENFNQYDGRENLYTKLEIMGEINLSITVIEQVVLAEPEYAKMMNFMNNDNDIELPLNLAHMAVGELDRLAELLIRIYEANNRLILRFSQLAAIEINGDLSTASILFRANTLLTKMLEAYMRLVGRSFLESSIGPVVRRICIAKTELEIDPAKLKPSLSAHQKEKIVTENVKELKKICNEIWQSMYINRSKCPNRLRKIFVKIQELVGNAYADQDMRLTSISAFVFLRFFVPAILNPRLFSLIQFQPDGKSQRTLTLIAKTLQGLGNLTLFGIKEPWMSVMNEFITTQLDSFRDYISFIASESDSTKPEWTSKEYEGYGLPYALRASLPSSSRDGIPTLPHLLDPVRDCSLLASLMTIINKKASGSSSSKHHSSVLPPKTTNRPRRYTDATEPSEKAATTNSDSTADFLKICGDLYAKSERRYVKIIQSESKTSNAPNRTTATTATTPAISDIQNPTTASPGLLPPVTSTQGGSPQSSLNCRTWALNSNDRIEQLSPALSTQMLKSPSTDSTTRWKRSHTITAEQGSSAAYNHSDHLMESPSTPSKQSSLGILGIGPRPVIHSNALEPSPKFSSQSPQLPSSGVVDHNHNHFGFSTPRYNSKPNGSGTLLVGVQDYEITPQYSQESHQGDRRENPPERQNSSTSVSSIVIEKRSSLKKPLVNRLKDSIVGIHGDRSSSSSLSLSSLGSFNSPFSSPTCYNVPTHCEYFKDQNEGEGSPQNRLTPTNRSTSSINALAEATGCHPSLAANPTYLLNLNHPLVHRNLSSSSSPSSPVIPPPSSTTSSHVISAPTTPNCNLASDTPPDPDDHHAQLLNRSGSSIVHPHQSSPFNPPLAPSAIPPSASSCSSSTTTTTTSIINDGHVAHAVHPADTSGSTSNSTWTHRGFIHKMMRKNSTAR